jgi:hypothetical protein
MSSSPTVDATEPFVNESFLDFSLPENKVKMQHSLNSVAFGGFNMSGTDSKAGGPAA